MKKQILCVAFALLSAASALAQDDLLKELESVTPKQKESELPSFKGLQICNMQSTKVAGKGEWYFLVSHRFGDLTQGISTFFGLDGAETKIGGIYGINKWLTVAASRHTDDNKTYEASIKYRLANQQVDGFPLTIVGFNTINFNSAVTTTQYPNLTFSDRLAYTTQALASRKFTQKISAELAAIYVHKNLYDNLTDQKDVFLLGAGARYKFNKRMSVNIEYAAKLNKPEGFTSPYENPLSIGWDIETGGHIFQLVFSNSQKMNDVAYFSNTNNPQDKKAIYFGFNLYRVFK